MAEVFGIASGALSVAGVAGQLAQSAIFLCGFIDDINKAPKNVRVLSEELRILTSILLEIQESYSGAGAELRNPLQHCGKRLDELLVVVKRIDPGQHTQKRKRLWSQCQGALKRSDLVKYLAELERCKLMLVQACNNISRTEQKFQTNQIASILQQTQDSATKQDINTAMTGASQVTIQEIRQISSSLQTTTTDIAETANKTKAKVDGTSVDMSRILENTELIRTMATRIESGQQTLIKDTAGKTTASFKSLQKEIDRSVAESIQRHLKVHFGLPSEPPERRPRIVEDADNSRPNSLTVVPNIIPTQHQSHGRKFPNSRPAPVRAVQTWIRDSSSQTRQTLVQNRMLGTMHMCTTTVTYSREDENGHGETKQVHTTIMSYLPPSWLTSRGAILNSQHSSTSCPGSRSTLHWSLSSINIVDDNAEIFKACLNLDLHKIIRLLDDGLASPFDVDPSGLTLIDYVASGTNLLKPGIMSTCYLMGQLEDINATLELLFANGARCTDMGIYYNPILVVASTWAFDMKSPAHGVMNNILRKLLKNFTNDPFCRFEAFININLLDGFCGEPLLLSQLWFQSSVKTYYNYFSPRQLNLLITQTEWPLTWHRHQLDVLCCAISDSFFPDAPELKRYVTFWVVSRANEISIYLRTKLELALKFINHDVLDTRSQHCVVRALHMAIFTGGEIITLLTQHPPRDDFPYRKPWIHHRDEKLVIIERWLTQLLRFILTKCSAAVMNTATLDELGQCAKRHNARMFRIWRKALKACTVEHARDLGLPQSSKRSLSNRTSVEDKASCITDTGSEWETECSDYDEGLEWEADYLEECEADYLEYWNHSYHDCECNNCTEDRYWNKLRRHMGLSSINNSSKGWKGVLHRLTEGLQEVMTADVTRN